MLLGGACCVQLVLGLLDLHPSWGLLTTLVYLERISARDTPSAALVPVLLMLDNSRSLSRVLLVDQPICSHQAHLGVCHSMRSYASLGMANGKRAIPENRRQEQCCEDDWRSSTSNEH